MLRLLLLCCVLWPGLASRADAAAPYSPAAVKAAYVLRFAAYVQWPASPADDAGFVIAVHGDDEVATQLERLGANRMLLGRPVQVRRIDSPAEAGDARIVFLGQGRRPDARSLRALARPGLLLVSDEGELAASTINFLQADNRVRFEVSLAAARRAELRIDSELLSVAARVLD